MLRVECVQTDNLKLAPVCSSACWYFSSEQHTAHCVIYSSFSCSLHCGTFLVNNTPLSQPQVCYMFDIHAFFFSDDSVRRVLISWFTLLCSGVCDGACEVVCVHADGLWWSSGASVLSASPSPQQWRRWEEKIEHRKLIRKWWRIEPASSIDID